MFELVDEGEEMDELPDTIEAFGKELEKFKLETLLSGEYDSQNAILRLTAPGGRRDRVPGLGGNAAQNVYPLGRA